MVVVLETRAYRLTVDPNHGATILAADWRKPDGAWMPLLAPLDEPSKGLSAGCFVMAPFSNRIRAGRFPFQGREIVFAMNRPDAGMACHGMARDLCWSIRETGGSHAVLQCAHSTDDYPWRFSLCFGIFLHEDGVELTLDMQNLADEALPFGFGLHPYFKRRPQTTVTFSSQGTQRKDQWGLPLPQVDTETGILPGEPLPVEAHLGLDSCFRDWAPACARIDWPTEQARLDLAAEGAFRHVHLFVPETRDVFCVEPVSHLPDAVNRPSLAASAAMHVLAPQETLSAALKLSMSTL